MKRNKNKYLFVGFGIWFLFITFIGFAPSFYLREEPEGLPFHLILHGIIFSLWIVLFMVQTALIFTKQVKLHMILGLSGLILILAMIPIGFYPVLYKVSIGTKTFDHAGHNLFALCAGFIFFFWGSSKERKHLFTKDLCFFLH